MEQRVKRGYGLAMDVGGPELAREPYNTPRHILLVL